MWNGGSIGSPQWNGNQQKITAYNPGISSLSSIVSYGLSSLLTLLNVDFSSLSSILSVDISTLSSLIDNYSTIAQQVVPGVSSLSTVVSYGLSSIRRMPNNGVSSLSTVTSYGLSSVANSLTTYSTSIGTTFSTSNLFVKDTLFAKNISTTNITQNTAIFLPMPGQTAGIIYTNATNDTLGLISLFENTSTFTVATANKLFLVGQASTLIESQKDITLKTLGSGFPRINLETLLVNIDAGYLNTQAIMSTNTISADIITANVGTFSTLNFVASNIDLTNIHTQSIVNDSNIQTDSLDVSGATVLAGNTTIGGETTMNGVTIFNNTVTTENTVTFNQPVVANASIDFGTNNSEFYGAQYLYDINSLRNLQVERITVLGGWTGDDILPPYYNDSIVEIGEDEFRPGQVTINGFNADPLDTGTALTVRGDTQITQNLNVLGLVTLEGEVEVLGTLTAQGDINILGGLQVEGTVLFQGETTQTGLLTCLGALSVAGIANLLGGVTVEAGIGILGALGLTGGNVSFGNSEDTGYNLSTYYTANFYNQVNFSAGVDVPLLTVGSATEGSTYTDRGLLFKPNTSDVLMWQLIRPAPDVPIEGTPPGGEGIYIELRNASNGELGGVGRLYDSGIYTPWANVTADLNMTNFNICNVNILSMTSIYGFDLSQSTEIQHWNPGTAEYDYYIPQLSYTDLSNNVTAAVASDWSYYPCKNLVLNMSNNFITNVGGITVNTLGTKQSINNYISAGLVYEQEPGDEVFWQISKPYFADPVLDPVGSEGIYIVERSTADGSDLQHGRIYDDTIYTPWAHVTGDLQMNQYDISNVKAMYYTNTRQPFIQYGDVSFAGGGTQTVTLPVEYIDTNYVVQATYSEDPGSSAKPIHIDSRTTSNFTISAQSGHAAYWTTYGNNN